MIETFLLIVNLLVALALVGVILMQRSEGGGLGMGGGSSGGGMGGFMSARGTTNFLTRTTAVLAIVFMTLSMVLAVMGQGRRQVSPFETPVGGPPVPGPAVPVGSPATPFIPPSGPAPAAPATPPATPSPAGAPVGR